MSAIRLLAMMTATSALCLLGGAHARASGRQSATPARHAAPQTEKGCPTREETDQALEQASALLQRAQYRSAAQVLETFAYARCDARAALLLSAAYEGSGEVAKTEETLQDAHMLWPSNMSIATSLAREYLNRKQIEKAAKALEDFRATPALPTQEMEAATVVFIAAHRLERAHTVAEMAYKSYPGLNTLLLLANVLQLEGKYKEVNRLLEGKRSTYGDSAPFLVTSAESEYDAMLYDESRADLERAVVLVPSSYQAHFLLGNVLVAQNEIDRAESEYRKSIELAPDQPRAYYQLALLLRSKQDEAGEEPLLKRALAADDQYAPAHCELGRILMGRRQLADAVTQLTLAIQENPRLEQPYYLLARSYAGLGQKDKADQTVRRYKALREANRHSAANTKPNSPSADSATNE